MACPNGFFSIFLVALMIVGVYCDDSATPISSTDEPLTIVANSSKSFSRSASWSLTVSPSGRAELVLLRSDSRKTKEFLVSQSQLQEIRKLLDEVNFLDIHSKEYGYQVLDGGCETIVVAVGDKVGSASIHHLGKLVKGDESHLLECARVLSVLSHVRSWIVEEEAIDMRPYYQKISEHAKSAIEKRKTP